MKRTLAIASALALVVVFALVPFIPNSPSPRDSTTLRTLETLQTVTSTFMVNTPLLIAQSSGGGEVRLNYGSDYSTKFFGSDQFAQVGLNLADRTLDRAMVEAVRASGNDTNIQIAGDGHSATLKPGQTVYYGVMLTESGVAKADAVTFVLKTVPIFGVPDITSNYFTIKYAELIGGGTSLGDINVRDDSTSGKAFQVIRPAGNRLFFFAFTAFAKTGGIRTTIDP